MKFINWYNVFCNIVMALIVGAIANVATDGVLGQNEVACGILLLGVTYNIYTIAGRKRMKGLLFAGLQKEIWTDHIEGEIFKDNSFLKYAKKVPETSLLGGRVVHIQQSGGAGNVVKNRQVIPAKTRKRQDNDVIYLLADYTTDPVVIPFTEEKELSSEYRNSVLGEDRDKLVQEVAENAIISWLSSDNYSSYGETKIPGTSILSSTGANGVSNNPLGDAIRKLTTISDLQRMRTAFLNDDRWFEGKMYGLLTPQQEAEMFPANDLVTQTAMQMVSEEERRNGVMYMSQGWKLMTRSSVVHVDAGGDVKVPGEALTSTDDYASMFWYEGAVEHTVGQIEPFFKYRDPNNYGDVFSFLIYSGGRSRRADYKGIKLLKQAK